jgi:hypothetical protein
MFASDQAIAWFGKDRIAPAASIAIAVLAGPEHWLLIGDVGTEMCISILTGTDKVFWKIVAIAIILLDLLIVAMVIGASSKSEWRLDALNLSQDKLNANQSITGCYLNIAAMAVPTTVANRKNVTPDTRSVATLAMYIGMTPVETGATDMIIAAATRLAIAANALSKSTKRSVPPIAALTIAAP